MTRAKRWQQECDELKDSLRECPFCGSHDDVLLFGVHGDGVTIRCTVCPLEMVGAFPTTPRQLRERWNTREPRDGRAHKEALARAYGQPVPA